MANNAIIDSESMQIQYEDTNADLNVFLRSVFWCKFHSHIFILLVRRFFSLFNNKKINMLKSCPCGNTQTYSASIIFASFLFNPKKTFFLFFHYFSTNSNIQFEQSTFVYVYLIWREYRHTIDRANENTTKRN